MLLRILKITLSWILRKILNPTSLAMAALFHFENANLNSLITNLQNQGIIRKETVIKGMKSVDRANYCLKNGENPYYDMPQYIGHDATISAPHMHGYALECLEPAIMVKVKILLS